VYYRKRVDQGENLKPGRHRGIEAGGGKKQNPMSLMGNTKTPRVYKTDHTCKDGSLQLTFVYGTVF